MTILTIYPKSDPQAPKIITDAETITSSLRELGIRFERWRADRNLDAQSDQEEIIAAYHGEIVRLMEERGFQSADVISLTPDHPNKLALREKFLQEHTHSEDEVRFFVDGCGLFYLHINEDVYSLLCEKNDLLSVPAGVKHWFDMGEAPFFKCIRLFTRPDGWVAEFTGSSIAQRFPYLDEEA